MALRPPLLCPAAAIKNGGCCAGLYASLASVTEPMDFLFCFSAPVLWLAHAAISGAFIVLLHQCHVTAFTSNLLGSLAMNLSAGAARTHYPVLYLLGLAQIAVIRWSSRRSSKRWTCPRRADARRSLSGRRRHRWTIPGVEKAHRRPRRAGEHLHGGQLLYPPAGHGDGCGPFAGAGAEGAACSGVVQNGFTMCRSVFGIRAPFRRGGGAAAERRGDAVTLTGG